MIVLSIVLALYGIAAVGFVIRNERVYQFIHGELERARGLIEIDIDKAREIIAWVERYEYNEMLLKFWKPLNLKNWP